MGLFGIGKDVNSTVTLEYKANVEQAKAALRDLSGEQKKNAQAAVQGLEDQVKAHERLASKITLGIGIAAGAVALGIQGFKQYEEASRLSAASAGADMDRLRSASHGLLTDMELMGIAAVGMNGKFKLTSEELETVLGAAVTLERRGLGPLAEITAKLSEDIRKGEIGTLKDLGVAYDENLAKTDKRAASLQALTALSKQSADGTNSETEAVRAHGVEFRNSMDQIQESIGKIVVALEPLIGALSTVVGIAAGAAGVVADIVGAIAGSKASRAELARFKGKGGWMGAAADLAEQETSWTEDVMWQRGTGLAGIGAAAVGAATSSVNAERERVANMGEMARRRREQFNYEKRKAEQERSAGVGNKPRTGGGFELNAIVLDGSQWIPIETVDTLIDQMVQARLAELPFGTLGTEASDALAGSAPTARGYMAGSAVGAMGTGRMGVRLKEGPSFMERMLGPVSEIDRYATAWGTFTDAATAGYMALVDGSESAGAAMKRVIAQSVAAEGSRMLVLALREGAEAVAAIARGNFAAAGSHALAAAKFGAGAAIAGVVANQLGGGGSAGASAGAGATSPTGVTAGATEGGPITRNYIIGDSFGFETPRSQAARFANAERRTRMYEAPTAGVEYA